MVEWPKLFVINQESGPFVLEIPIELVHYYLSHDSSSSSTNNNNTLPIIYPKSLTQNYL